MEISDTEDLAVIGSALNRYVGFLQSLIADMEVNPPPYMDDPIFGIEVQREKLSRAKRLADSWDW